MAPEASHLRSSKRASTKRLGRSQGAAGRRLGTRSLGPVPQPGTEAVGGRPRLGAYGVSDPGLAQRHNLPPSLTRIHLSKRHPPRHSCSLHKCRQAWPELHTRIHRAEHFRPRRRAGSHHSPGNGRVAALDAERTAEAALNSTRKGKAQMKPVVVIYTTVCTE
ncbi:hypothetical protein NDU88_004942 [Pleurodeles waltl]|uniref:Uncharacterized protein n=1 Tax=Pleurodeles waltl TaxID=8319 RepID=A0AAV7NL41_PLEWA|nr:hypothetical protein NDU88_004942 [Pleurodeles waltl]